MKKILFMLILLIPVIVFAEDISISSFEVNSTSGLGKVVSDPSHEDMNINVYNEFSNVGDTVTYDLVINNNSDEDVEINNNIDNSDYVDYMLIASDSDYVIKKDSNKSFQLVVKYANQPSESSFVGGVVSDNKNITIELSEKINDNSSHGIEDNNDIIDGGNTNNAVDPKDNKEDKVINPNTKDIIGIVCIVSIVSVGILLVRKKIKIGRYYIIICIMIGVVPFVVYAIKNVNITLKANTKINEPTIIYPEGKNINTVSNGDIVKIAREEFYVIDSNSNEVVLLAKYNLKTEGKYNELNSYEAMPPDFGAVMQSNESGRESNSIFYNVLGFSYNNYWSGKVGTTYSGAYNSSNYPYVYDSNSFLYQYIGQYKLYLESKGASVKEARLLKYSEAIELGCNETSENCNNAPNYVTSTSYWLGNAESAMFLWVINSDKEFIPDSYMANIDYGIRPVIVLNKEQSKNEYICRRATVLHTEKCEREEEGCVDVGYTVNGSKGTTTITYGNLGTKGTLNPGDAFDCDVNGDGVYDADTERFYYLEDNYYYASFVYYNNVANGVPSNTSPFAYNTNSVNTEGPISIYTHLPSKEQWKNVELINSLRPIRSYYYEAGLYDSDYITLHNYGDRAARLLTFPEVVNICPGNDYLSIGYLDNCLYFVENTRFANDTHMNYWMENPLYRDSDNVNVFRINGNNRRIGYTTANSSDKTGVRPVIEVPLKRVNY